MSRVYLDHAATSPLTADARDVLLAALADGAANASSLHLDGQRTRARIEEARSRLAEALGVEDDEVLFTGSGTESDNLALRGVVWAADVPAPHVVASAIEHDAVLRTARWLAARGDCTLDLVRPEADGRVRVEALLDAVRPETVLVSLMHVNNETGVLQPVAELARALAERPSRSGRRVLVHVDAVQAPGKVPLRPRELGADLLTLSAHKAGGPSGCGALFVRRGLKLQPVLTGGSQEQGLRPGTENAAVLAAGAHALAAALHEVPEATAPRATRLAELSRRLEDGLLALPGVSVHGREAPRAPGLVLAGFDGAEAAVVLPALDVKGFSVATGSACTSGSARPSHVLAAMGVPPDRARQAVRFSLGPGNDTEQVDRLLGTLPETLDAVRQEVRS